MIVINLLPQEFRRGERTPFKVFGSLLLAVLMASGSLVYLGHMYFNEYKRVEARRSQLEDRLKSLEPFAKYDDALIAERAEYQKRSQTIQTIANSRVLWTKVLDQLIDITFNEGNTERHNVWFKSLEARSGRGKSGPVMSLQAFCESDEFTKQANFLDDIEHNEEFFRDFLSITSPGGRVVRNENKEPPEAISFKLDLRMKPPSQWARNKKKR